MEVFSLSDAMNWFLENSSGSIVCVKNVEKCECNSYPEAKSFFQREDIVPKMLKRRNVIVNKEGRKEVIFEDRVLQDGEKFFSEKAHEDDDFSYLCTNQYCRCMQ